LVALGILVWFQFGRRLLFFSVLILFLLEAALRIAEPFVPSPFMDAPDLGIKHKPSHLSANSLGFNDQEYPKEKGKKKRIVALGDSFNWAGGYEHNYWTLAETMLQDDLTDANIEILNQGTPKVGPAYLLKLLMQESILFDPDTVVLSFFVGNDFVESDPNVVTKVRLGYPIDIYLNEQGVFKPTRDSYLWFLFSRSQRQIADILFKQKEKAQGMRAGFFSRKIYLDIQKERMELCQKDDYPSADWQEVKERLQEFKTYLEARAIQFYVVILPDEFQVSRALQDELFAQFTELDVNDFDFELPQRKLKKYLSDLNIEFLDLLPFFVEESERGQELYAYSDTHFNNNGNALAARVVSQFLAEHIKILK